MGLSTYTTTRTIAASGTASEQINGGNVVAASVTLPAAMTGDALTFQTRNADDGTWATAQAEGADVAAIDIAVNETHEVPQEVLMAKWWRVVSDETEAAERTLTVNITRATA